jgi:hemoglobin
LRQGVAPHTLKLEATAATAYIVSMSKVTATIDTKTGVSGHPIDRQQIHAFVVDFYSRVRKEDVLGPIFDHKIGDHWDAHFETLTNFWMTVLHGVASYKGNPFAKHQNTPGIKPELFDRWLEIFAESAEEMLPKTLADIAKLKAGRIADSLKQGLFFRAG